MYNRPRTPAVAAFIGTLNLLRAEVVDAATGAALIEGQPMRLPLGLDSGADGTVSVALRPETLAFAGADSPANRLQGTIEDTAFLGTVIRFRVRVGAQTLHVDALNNPGLRLPTPGQQVQVAFAPENCIMPDTA